MRFHRNRTPCHDAMRVESNIICVGPTAACPSLFPLPVLGHNAVVLHITSASFFYAILAACLCEHN